MMVIGSGVLGHLGNVFWAHGTGTAPLGVLIWRLLSTVQHLYPEGKVSFLL